MQEQFRKRRRLLNYLRLFVGILLFAAIAFLSEQIVSRSLTQQIRKYDYANINHMKYGLFSVSVWKDKMASIIVKEIEKFEINETNKVKIKEHMEVQLNGLIDKVADQVRDANKGSTTGWVKQKFIDALVDVEDIKKGIPGYADLIVQEMTKDKTQQQLKEVVKERIDKYLKNTFEPEDKAEIDEIVKRLGVSSEEEARKLLTEQTPLETEKLQYLAWQLIGLSAFLFLVLGFHRTKLPATHFFLCLATLLTLLFVGVTCPMIDMEAKVSKFGFIILGYPISFENQMVYFQSKSIIDVFWIMMSHKDVQMKVVGVLMVMFSVVFPLLKMSSSIFYYYNVFGAQKRWWVKFFVLKSGKWSMADVQVVAILMAYIGFNGMVTSQFSTLSAKLSQVEMITTNGTSLQIGFYIFISYATLAMFLPSMIDQKTPTHDHAQG